MAHQLTVKSRTKSSQALAMAPISEESQAPVVKKRKLNGGDEELSISVAAPSRIELRNGGIGVKNHNSEEKLWPCCSTLDNRDELVSVSCCSSNGSSERVKERTEFLDLEMVNDDCVEKKMESMAETDSCRRKSTVVGAEKMNMPSKLEIEEFFAEAEKNIQKGFAEKYNFDIAKDEPLQGRYQWVRMRP
ncbi:uncharacterized protein [Rutidosis leptorrhynchoides]|uniref:uncharacterized protein n=1 Tax=Rutidosis leptorrhynchoides TaxID=125765 RepID=UPI003A9993BC